MVESIVQFISNISQACINIALSIYDSTDTWQLVSAGITVLLISRFILGPILGSSFSGGSDKVSHNRNSKRNSNSDKKSVSSQYGSGK